MTLNNTKYVTIRFEGQLLELLEKVCRLRGETRSSFIRRAVNESLAKLSYLDADAKKALGFAVRIPGMENEPTEKSSI